MTAPDELQRAVEGLDTALRSKASHVELRDVTPDLRLLLSERAELLATVERMRGALERIAQPEYGIGFNRLRGIARAALTTGEGK